jgi:hypothetical protein
MKFNEFFNEENHLCNFSEEQIKEIFDLDEVKALDNNEFEKQRVFWLSQYMVGNVSEPFNEIKKLDPADQRRALETWIDLIKDIDTLKPLMKSILMEFIQGKAV